MSPLVPSSNIKYDWNLELYTLVVTINSTRFAPEISTLTILPKTFRFEIVGGINEISECDNKYCYYGDNEGIFFADGSHLTNYATNLFSENFGIIFK